MPNLTTALRDLSGMDDLAAGRSPVHRLSPLSKLLVTIAYIAAVLSYGKYQLSSMVPMLLYPVALFQLSGIPVRACFYKLRLALPLVLAVGLFNPLFDRAPLLAVGGVAVSGGVVSMLTLMLKGTLALMASFLLMATTGIDALCAALRRLRVPGLLVTLLLLTYRYVGVMAREVSVMSEAYSLRAPGQRGVHHSAWGSFLGQLLLRSMDRAEELYASMRLRGFRGEFHYADMKPLGPADALYAALSLGAIALFRFVDVAALLGSLIVR